MKRRVSSSFSLFSPRKKTTYFPLKTTIKNDNSFDGGLLEITPTVPLIITKIILLKSLKIMVFIVCLYCLGSDDGHIKLLDVSNGTLVGTMSGHTSWVLSVAFSPDAEHFASSSSDHSVKIWEISSRQCVHTFNEHTSEVL